MEPRIKWKRPEHTTVTILLYLVIQTKVIGADLRILWGGGVGTGPPHILQGWVQGPQKGKYMEFSH